jgi:transposase
VIHGFRKETPMNRDQFWLTDTQFSRIEPLKDVRRVATRYDRHAVTFLAAVCIAAAVSYWL